MRILVAEDLPTIAKSLYTMLATQHYAIDIAADGRSAWRFIDTYEYDLLIVDEVLSKLDGISLCRQVRSSGKQMPILLIASQNDGHQKSIGLDAGADDYMVQPIDGEELVARVRALLRRHQTTNLPILSWGDLHLESCSRIVTFEQKSLSLTPKEYALLELLLHDQFANVNGENHRVFSYGVIIEHLWVGDDNPSEETVRTHMKGLRHKLKLAGMITDPIETVYGVGYRLRPAPVSTKVATSPPPEQQFTLLIADPDLATTTELTTIAQQADMLVQTVGDLESLRSQLGLDRPPGEQPIDQQPQLLLLELAITADLTAARQLLAAIDRLTPPLPVVVWSSCSDLDTRLMVAQSSARWFIAKPHATQFVFQIIREVAQQQLIDRERKILVIHNDQTAQMSLHQTLEPLNYHLTALRQPQQLWSTLAMNTPDLVIIDLNLGQNFGEVDGLTLCRLLRQDAHWRQLPIVALTDQIDAATMHKIFLAGANDVLIKPLATPEVVIDCLQRILGPN
jgi:DNA-binding response OmpR family regulator